ncbi:hypothetical protein NPIL_546821 [Nephila pilipes]|uniref:Uncharacterized protein n=1 Tax=Nephila pilipes TaxID=299642 RepID=A0A8X6QUK7_NEPPI|nr:hypothetical protein NPIL_546821 [Nephila pilipes]
MTPRATGEDRWDGARFLERCDGFSYLRLESFLRFVRCFKTFLQHTLAAGFALISVLRKNCSSAMPQGKRSPNRSLPSRFCMLEKRAFPLGPSPMDGAEQEKEREKKAYGPDAHEDSALDVFL